MTLFDQAVDLISDFRPFHSNFQIHGVIIGSAEFGDDSEESAYGAYLQIQREIQSRLSALSSQRTELHRMQMNYLEQFKRARSWFCWTRVQQLKREIAKSEEARLSFEIAQINRTTADVVRELEVFVERGERIKAQVRAWSAEEREQVELVWWMRRWERRLTSCLLYDSRAAGQIIESIADLPASIRTKLRDVILKSNGALAFQHTGRILNALQELPHGSHHGTRQLDSSARPHSISSQDSRLHRSLPRAALAYQTARS